MYIKTWAETLGLKAVISAVGNDVLVFYGQVDTLTVTGSHTPYHHPTSTAF